MLRRVAARFTRLRDAGLGPGFPSAVRSFYIEGGGGLADRGCRDRAARACDPESAGAPRERERRTRQCPGDRKKKTRPLHVCRGGIILPAGSRAAPLGAERCQSCRAGVSRQGQCGAVWLPHRNSLPRNSRAVLICRGHGCYTNRPFHGVPGMDKVKSARSAAPLACPNTFVANFNTFVATLRSAAQRAWTI